MWIKIFQENISDHVALVVHAYLLSGDLLATWAVAAGIIWESIFSLRSVAHRLIVWGVVAEMLCSLALFSFDEGISAAQQSTIERQQVEISDTQRHALGVMAATSWRDLPLKASMALTNSLREGPGGDVVIGYEANDPESLYFATALSGPFDTANLMIGKSLWRVSLQPRVYSRKIYAGVWIDGQSIELKKYFEEVFSKIGLISNAGSLPNTLNDSPGVTAPAGPVPAILIFVGPKERPNLL
jgi:hypothetical protein